MNQVFESYNHCRCPEVCNGILGLIFKYLLIKQTPSGIPGRIRRARREREQRRDEPLLRADQLQHQVHELHERVHRVCAQSERHQHSCAREKHVIPKADEELRRDIQQDLFRNSRSCQDSHLRQIYRHQRSRRIQLRSRQSPRKASSKSSS